MTVLSLTWEIIPIPRKGCLYIERGHWWVYLVFSRGLQGVFMWVVLFLASRVETILSFLGCTLVPAASFSSVLFKSCWWPLWSLLSPLGWSGIGLLFGLFSCCTVFWLVLVICSAVGISVSLFSMYGFRSGGRLNKKDGLTRCGDSHVKDKTS